MQPYHSPRKKEKGAKGEEERNMCYFYVNVRLLLVFVTVLFPAITPCWCSGALVLTSNLALLLDFEGLYSLTPTANPQLLSYHSHSNQAITMNLLVYWLCLGFSPVHIHFSKFHLAFRTHSYLIRSIKPSLTALFLTHFFLSQLMFLFRPGPHSRVPYYNYWKSQQ